LFFRRPNSLRDACPPLRSPPESQNIPPPPLNSSPLLTISQTPLLSHSNPPRVPCYSDHGSQDPPALPLLAGVRAGFGAFFGSLVPLPCRDRQQVRRSLRLFQVGHGGNTFDFQQVGHSKPEAFPCTRLSDPPPLPPPPPLERRLLSPPSRPSSALPSGQQPGKGKFFSISPFGRTPLPPTVAPSGPSPLFPHFLRPGGSRLSVPSGALPSDVRKPGLFRALVDVGPEKGGKKGAFVIPGPPSWPRRQWDPLHSACLFPFWKSSLFPSLNEDPLPQRQHRKAAWCGLVGALRVPLPASGAEAFPTKSSPSLL